MDVTMFEVSDVDAKVYEGDGETKQFYTVDITDGKGGTVTIHSHKPGDLIHLLRLCIRDLEQLKGAYDDTAK